MKKRRRRRDYLNDYRTLPEGGVVYIGKTYAYSGDKPWKRSLAKLWLSAGLAVCCILLCGIIPAKGMMNTFYIIIPWLLAFTGVCSVIWTLCRISVPQGELKADAYRAAVSDLPVRSVFTAICGAVTVIAQAAGLAFGGFGKKPAADICLMLLMAASAALTTFVRRLAGKLCFEER